MTNAQYFAIVAVIIFAPRMSENMKTFVFWISVAASIISAIGARV
jgi:hypothetical protein